LASSAGSVGAGTNGQEIFAHLLNLSAHRALGSFAQRDDQCEGKHADEYAERGQCRAQRMPNERGGGCRERHEQSDEESLHRCLSEQVRAALRSFMTQRLDWIKLSRATRGQDPKDEPNERAGR
jgi:hypothetical protein